MFLLGLLLIGAGVFLLVYGGMLFRFTLAVGAFVLGFSLAMWLLSSQALAIRLLLSFVVGGAAALIGYRVVKMVLHLAGVILGAILVLLFASLLPVRLPDILVIVFILVGGGVVGFFGNRFGDWVIILATTLTGAYAILLGLIQAFPVSMGVTAGYASAQIPFTGQVLLIYLIFFAVGVLAQFEIRRTRGRYVNLR